MLTSTVLAATHFALAYGPKVVYGEACLLGDARLAADGITFSNFRTRHCDDAHRASTHAGTQALSRQALEALAKYLRAARTSRRADRPLTRNRFGYNAAPFGESPCVCLRIPTGGGKTLLAAHAIGRMAREWPAVDPKPLALWLVPSDTIRSQTLKPWSRQAIPSAMHWLKPAATMSWCAIWKPWPQLSPQDFDQRAVVIVATIQSFRVEDTDQRNVYAFSEAFERHFRGTSPAALNALRDLPDALVTAG